MSERIGVLAGVLSCTFGGAAAVATRHLVGDIDSLGLAAFRFGLGFLFLLPLALRERWPRGRDWIGVALLGLLFFAVFFVLYNLALAYTTAARGALALSVLPLVTMALAAVLGVERLTPRKTTGVFIAIAGVAAALGTGLVAAPPGAWRGDLIMAGATVCMALYSIWSRPFVARSSALGFLVAGMGVGAAAVIAIAALRGSFAPVAYLALDQWGAILYLGMFGGAAAFWLWIWALQRATPTRVTATMTVNPVAAGLLAALLLGEPFGLNLLLGCAAVFAGIAIATTEPRPKPVPAT
ncbi:MAG TPA: DMT family transporter [Alphaproteobacteria bacterium]|jgi:drug/metabolite transporter (DMT)-like permease